MRRASLYILSVFAAVLLAFGCGGTGTSSVTITFSPTDGSTDVAVNVTVTATFSGAITDPADWTVVLTLKKNNAGDSLCTDVTYDSGTLTATCAHDDLVKGASYTITVSGLKDAEDKDIGTVTATFATFALNLLRLDGTELELSAKPIPRAIRIRAYFDEAPDDSQRAEIQSGFILKRGDTALDKTFSWSTDYTQLTVTPARWFEYGATYTVGISDTVVSGAPETDFTTTLWGDVNGDGYSDVVVGGPFAAVMKGKSYLFLGSGTGVANCDMSAGCSPHATITGAADSDFLYSPSMAGDVNADGYADIVVGAPGVQGMKGQAYVFHGSGVGISDCDLSAACTPDATVTGQAASDTLGFAVSAAGDVDGDGYDDIIVGADKSESQKGRAYIFLGSDNGIDSCDLSGSCIPATVITGAHAQAGNFFGDRLGVFVSSGGDLNNDGYGDILVGTLPEEALAVAMDGYAYLFLGSSNGIDDCDLSAGPCADSTEFKLHIDYYHNAMSISSAGDVNGDGYDDLIIGSRYAEGRKGEAYIFSGTASPINSCELFVDCTPEAFVRGEGAGDYLGHAVSGAGDVNGDGYDDILLGAFGTDGNKGKAYIIFGSSEGIRNCDLAGTCLSEFSSVTGANADDRLGTSVSGAGDVDADGYPDVILGAPNDVSGGNPTALGHAYILRGSGTGIGDLDLATQAADTTLTGANIEDCFGVFY